MKRLALIALLALSSCAEDETEDPKLGKSANLVSENSSLAVAPSEITPRVDITCDIDSTGYTIVDSPFNGIWMSSRYETRFIVRIAALDREDNLFITMHSIDYRGQNFCVHFFAKPTPDVPSLLVSIEDSDLTKAIVFGKSSNIFINAYINNGKELIGIFRNLSSDTITLKKIDPI
ncbi:MAG: hypothetical protein ACOH5I_25900 [Oligoflexus sp.]